MEGRMEKEDSSGSCPSSKFDCAKDFGHKTVVLFASEEGTDISKNAKCVWFSKEYGEPVIVMHTNYYKNSECFLIDSELSFLRLHENHEMLLFKEFIHIVEEGDTKFTLQFKDESDSFHMWIQICSLKNLEPFATNKVKLNNPKSQQSIPPPPPLVTVTMKFKTQNSNWYTFAKLEVISVCHSNGRVMILMKNMSGNEEPLVLFSMHTGVPCDLSGSQLTYLPTDSERSYILDFSEGSLCKRICHFLKIPTDIPYQTRQLYVITISS